MPYRCLGRGSEGSGLSPIFIFLREKPHVFREATSLVAFRNTCGFWANVSRLGFDSGVEDLPSAVAVFEGECVDFFFLVAAPGFLAAVGFYLGVFVPFVVGFQVVGLMVVGPGYAGGFEVFDAVDDPSAALVECFYFSVDFEFSVV